MYETIVLIDAVILNVILLLGSVTMIVISAVTLLRELREAGHTAPTATIVARASLFIVLPAVVFAASAMGLISCYIVGIGG